MASNIQVTQGTGTIIATDQITSDSSQAQIVKLAYSAAGVRTLVQADVNGMLVNVGQVQGTVAVTGNVGISGTPAVTVSGNVGITGTPAVTVSSGSVSISGPAAVTQSGSWTVGVSGTVAATQSGSWNVATLTTITNPVTVTGTVALSGTSPVSGTVTANQGTAGTAGASWFMKLSDGTNFASLTNVGGSQALNVNVLAQAGGGVSYADTATFTGGTTAAVPIQGVFNDSLTAVGSGKSAAVRITANRGQHVNLRDSSGNEMGLVGQPVYVQTVGGTQTVNGTITANQGGAPWSVNQTEINGAAVAVAAAGVQKVGISDAAGAAFSQVNPLQTQNAPSGGSGGAAQTAWKFSATISTASSSTTLHTPAGGKTAYVEGIVIVVAGTPPYTVTIYDNTNAAANIIFAGSPPQSSIVITPARPIPLSAVNNLLRVDVGSGTPNVSITVWGYDA